MNKILRKGIAMFCSVILVFAFLNFAIAFSSESVSAAPLKDTCVLTGKGNYCVEVDHGAGWASDEGCEDRYQRLYKAKDDPTLTDCQVGVCVPSGAGSCLENVEKIRCQDEAAGTFYPGAVKETVSDCAIGCCELRSSCSLQESKVCTEDLGGAINTGITGRQECNFQCADAQLGCYQWPQGGRCEYGPLGEFNTNDFVAANWHEAYRTDGGPFCSEVYGCPSYHDGHKYKACGDGTTDDDKWDVYYYDSAGNREDVADECRPERMCHDPDSAKGGDDAYCLTTNCVDNYAGAWPDKFRSGESICMNVVSGFFANDRKSKGLENYMLTCQNREILANFDDEELHRGSRCEESVSSGNNSRVEADWIPNDWKRCHNECGEGRTLADVLNYAPGVGTLIAGLVGKQCTTDTKWPADEKCSDFGDCGGGPLMSHKGYDRDIWAPIGSCNPNYPPGEGASDYGDPNDRCGQCGKGGDGAINVCTEFECNAMGDCQFEKDSFPGVGVAHAGAFAIGVMAASAAICALPFVPCDPLWVAGAAVSLSWTGVLFWGLVSIVYGYAAATGTNEAEVNLVDDIWYDEDDEIYRLSYLLSLANHLDKVLTNEEKEELAEATGVDYERQYPTNALIAGGGTWVGASVLSMWPHILPGIFRLALQGPVQAGEAALGSVASGELLGMSSSTVAKIFGAVGVAASLYSMGKALRTGSCIPERSYTNSDHCEECGLEGQWFCTEERCKILGGDGGWCAFVKFDLNGKDGLCLPHDPSDHTSPEVTFIDVDLRDADNLTIVGHGPYSATGRHLEISQPFDWDTDHMNVKINTTEISQCGYSFIRGTSYEETTKFPHTASSEHEVDVRFSAADKVRGQTYLYIRCTDITGNENEEDRDYIRFVFEGAPDEAPPEIDHMDPLGVTVPETVTQVNLKLWAYDKNGVNGCRYSKDTTVTNYVDMTDMTKTTSEKCTRTDETCQRFEVNLDLSEAGWCQDLSNDPTYPIEGLICPLNILCKDNQNNVMENVVPWMLTVWPSFSLSVIKPNQSQEFWAKEFDMEIHTGTDARCKYQLNSGSWNNFTDTFSMDTVHTITHEDLIGSPGGNPYSIVFECEDHAGNVVQNQTSIIAFADLQPPVLYRVWTKGNNLHILVDEESACKYSNTERGFVWGDDVEGVIDMMPAKQGTEHYASLGEDAYYIRCRDIWDNENTATFVIYP